MPRRVPVILALLLALLLGPALTLAQDDPLQATTKTVNVELILDASGSMAEVLPDGETRMAAAKRILRGVIEGLPERAGVNVGLRVYGHLGDNTETGKQVSCRSSELLVPVAGLDKAALVARVEAIQPTGWTPIAYSLEQAAADFQPGGESITNAVVLVTDGEETCDPPQQSCDAASALHQGAVTVTTHVVGFALTPEQTELVRCVAEEGGGQLFGADNAEELSTALGEALEGVGVTLTPVAIPPAAPAVSLTEIRTLAYHQLTGWQTPLFGRGIEVGGETAPIISDDGQRIAFGNHPGEGAADPRNRIFVINADGSGEREVDAYPFLCFCASMIDLSADGSRIVSSDAVQLRVADGNGGGGRELLALASNEIDAVAISGDGSTVVFRIYRDTSIRDTSPAQPIERGIYLINADGSGLRQIVGPSQIAPLLGVAPADAPFFSAIFGVDVSTTGGQIVFGMLVAPEAGGWGQGLFAVNRDGSGLHQLLERVGFVLNGAISGDGQTVAYVVENVTDSVQEAGVVGFDGGGQRKLTDNTTGYPGLGGIFNLPSASGDRIQLSGDGTRLLFGSTGLLYDTTSGDRLILGATTPSIAGDPTPLVIDGLARPTMNADATRFAYVFQPVGEPYQVARLDLNPGDLGGAPSVTEASVTPPFILTETRSTATVSARVSTPNAFLRVGSRVLYRGLPDPNVNTWYYGPMVDDGTTLGDAVAGDGVFTYDGIGTDCCAEVGPRIVRVKAETQAADGLRHATAVDVMPFAVVANPGDVPAPASPAATAAPATATAVVPTATVVPPTATLVPATAAPTATGECRWTGTWSTSFGTMRLTQSDSTVSGDYEHDQGQIRGTVSGQMIIGTWTEAPSRQPPSDAGEIEFTLADDCQSFTGRWRYDSTGEWQPGWDGQLQGAPGPTPTPLPTVPPTATSVPPTATSVPPTVTPLPPTSTPVPPPTATPVPPPTATTVPPTPIPPTPIPPTAVPPSTMTAGQTPTGPGTGNTCNCEELAAARATIAAQATRIAELEGGNPPTPPPAATPEASSSPTPTPTGAGPATPPSTDFTAPAPAECTVTPRTADELAALATSPDQAAVDALAAARAQPGLDIPQGTAADEATMAAVEAIYRTMTACFNAGNDLAAYALWSDESLRQLPVTSPTAPPTPLAEGERMGFQVREVRLLPDGRVAAVWDQLSFSSSASVVQVLAMRNGQYLIDETIDIMIPAIAEAANIPSPTP